MSELTGTEGAIDKLNHETLMKVVRDYSKKIGLLASRGDPLSATVKVLYEYLYEHPTDPKADAGFRSAFKDWMIQHLEISSRVELARKYGYLVEGEDPNAKRILTIQ